MDGGQGAPTFGAGRFEVRGTLGAGGAGVVYRVFDRVLGREVALKQLRHASGRDLLRFKREFRSLADITHPNLVAFHELHELAGEWFLTMELVEGVSWLDWVRPTRGTGGPRRTRQDIAASPVSAARLRGALIQLVDGLIALHTAGQLHRDLKPSNVVVSPQGRLALLDFGLVATLAELDPERLAVGTPVYMSPEQASDRPLGEASDWYGVGCMLFEALTGRRPFEGEPEQVMTRKQTEQPPSPAVLVPGVPPDLARLAMALLAPRAAARPDGRAILAMLGAAPSARTRLLAQSQPPPVLLDRTAELAALRRALDDAAHGGVSVVVSGPRGAGKSTLLRRFLRDVAEQVVVLEGRCFEREVLPFKLIDGVVDSLTGALVGRAAADLPALAPPDAAALVRLFPVARRIAPVAERASQAVPDLAPDPDVDRLRGLAVVRALIRGLARLRPVIVVVDDVHWGDAPSCELLAELIHTPEAGLLVIVAHEPALDVGVLARLCTGGRAAEIRGVVVPARPVLVPDRPA